MLLQKGVTLFETQTPKKLTQGTENFSPYIVKNPRYAQYIHSAYLERFIYYIFLCKSWQINQRKQELLRPKQ